jgi:hypothetical protein
VTVIDERKVAFSSARALLGRSARSPCGPSLRAPGRRSGPQVAPCSVGDRRPDPGELNGLDRCRCGLTPGGVLRLAPARLLSGSLPLQPAHCGRLPRARGLRQRPRCALLDVHQHAGARAQVDVRVLGELKVCTSATAPRELVMWMKNTVLPSTCRSSGDGAVGSIVRDTEPYSTKSIGSGGSGWRLRRTPDRPAMARGTGTRRHLLNPHGLLGSNAVDSQRCWHPPDCPGSRTGGGLPPWPDAHRRRCPARLEPEHPASSAAGRPGYPPEEPK